MGLLDGLLENVLGIGAQQSQGSMLQVALQVLEQNGGLPGIISKFEHGGMADHVGSWVGTGANMPISGAQLQEILGSGSIGEIAQRLGLVARRRELGTGAGVAAGRRQADARGPGAAGSWRYRCAGARVAGANARKLRHLSGGTPSGGTICGRAAFKSPGLFCDA